MRRSVIKLTLLFILAILIQSPALAGDDIRTGFFSNLWHHHETGDLIGYELYIAKTSDGYVGAFYECEGGQRNVQVIAPAFDGDVVTFSYGYPDSSRAHFKGTIDECGITGDIYWDEKYYNPEMRLKRKQTYWN